MVPSKCKHDGLKHMVAAALVATLVSAAPVDAQSATCKAQWTAFVDTLQGAGLTEMPSATLVRDLADGQCRVGAITLPVDSETTVTVQSVTWGGEDMDRFVNDALPPRALSVRCTFSSARRSVKVFTPCLKLSKCRQARPAFRTL